jgi:hypothetical protein
MSGSSAKVMGPRCSTSTKPREVSWGRFTRFTRARAGRPGWMSRSAHSSTFPLVAPLTMVARKGKSWARAPWFRQNTVSKVVPSLNVMPLVATVGLLAPNRE